MPTNLKCLHWARLVVIQSDWGSILPDSRCG